MARQEYYQGLARKYRPQTFEDLVGQEAVAQSFQSALRQGRVVHGHLLAGPRGVGKTTSARILAKALNCETGPTPTPCGTCRHCTDIAQGNDMDVIEIDAASNNSVDDVRELRERVIQAPFSARFKVYIIDEVHMLSTPAFNALLKTLEEPPARVIFILATTELEKIPETIRSRCVSHAFRRIGAEDVIRRLEQVATAERVQADPAELREVFALIARAVEGGMRDALVALDQLISMTEGHPSVEAANRLLGLADQLTLSQTIDWLAEEKPKELLQLIEELSDRGRNLERFVKGLIATLRDLMLLQATADDALVTLTGEALATARAQSRRIPPPTLYNMLNQLFELEGRLKQSTQTRFLIEFTLLRIAAVHPVVSIDEILNRIQAIPEASFAAPASLPANPPTPVMPNPQSAIRNPQSSGGAGGDARAPGKMPLAAVMNESAPTTSSMSSTSSTAASPLEKMSRDELLEAVVPQLPDTYRFLKRYLQAAAIRTEGAVVRLEWTPENGFARKQVEHKPENIRALERVLSELAGAPMRVMSVDAPGGAGPTAPPQPAAQAHSLWLNPELADAGPAPLPAEDAAEAGGGENEDEETPSVAAARSAAPAAVATAAPRTPEPPADTRTAQQKAQALTRSGEDAGRRVRLVQDMLGGRAIDENGQSLPV